MEPVAVITGGKGDLAVAIAAELEAGGRFGSIHCPGREELDVRDEEAVGRYFSALPRIDLLINNAGICRDGLVARMAPADWEDVLATNLRGSFFCSRIAARMMARQRSGHCIHLGSHAGMTGTPGQANYAASKSALVAFSQSLATEFGGRGVRSNVVLPGMLATRMSENARARNSEAILKAHALGRLNTAEEAARFIAFLDTLNHVSGQVFQLDSRVTRSW